jgi:hypothetical protein
MRNRISGGFMQQLAAIFLCCLYKAQFLEIQEYMIL